MKITNIETFIVDAGWRPWIFVKVETDEGVTGYGEICPLGAAYLPAYAAGARAGIAELAPRLIGLDPTQLALINQANRMVFRSLAQIEDKTGWFSRSQLTQ